MAVFDFLWRAKKRMFPPAVVSQRERVPGTPEAEEPTWRVRHDGRDGMCYEERHLGAWRTLRLNSEMQTGQAHHLVRFGRIAEWAQAPEWAQGRRDEIVRRIKEAC